MLLFLFADRVIGGVVWGDGLNEFREVNDEFFFSAGLALRTNNFLYFIKEIYELGLKWL